ncbi:NrdH-redoxin [Metabacillus iocasae]|uniref:Uncharacterized protein n=1 Tax=Priestia iocasae TaxID=2291674 RepID=A0ABS2QTL4_9BACI|nr:hypothetical protein [Metabacillus iocasae]
MKSHASCLYGVMLKHFLSAQRIPFREMNVEYDPFLMQKLVITTRQMGVSQTEVNHNGS